MEMDGGWNRGVGKLKVTKDAIEIEYRWRIFNQNVYIIKFHNFPPSNE
jgi:hypothetical protein